MAKRTLLQIVQEIANDIDTDEINSIGDTVESEQIAEIVRSTYQAIISNRNWPHTAKLVNINASGSSSLPNVMTISDDVKELISVYYDKKKLGETRRRFEEVKYVSPDDMLRIFYGRNTDSDNVDEIDGGSGKVYIILNDKAPTYYTSFDDTTLVFDSYDSEVDSTLQSSKTQVRAYVVPTFTVSDTFIPDLPEEAFSLLIEEAKSKASIKIAQKQDPKAEQESRRQNQWASRKAWRVNGGIKYIRFGRNRARDIDPTFERNN